ncbi:Wzz/FepE/Etk N-terminal domain-containing protein [Microbacterium sp. NPDC055683]
MMARILHALGAVRRRAWVLPVFLLLGMLGGFATAALSTPRFDAHATVAFTVQGAETPLGELAVSVYAQQRLLSYAEIVSTPVVLQAVINELDLDTTPDALAERVVATPLVDAMMIEITASSPFNTEAPEIAGAVAQQLADVIELQLESAMTGEGSALSVVVVREPTVPSAAAYPLLWPSLGQGALAGGLLGLGALLLLESFDGRIRSVADVRRASGVPVLGILPVVRRRDPVDAAGDGDGPVAAGVDALRWSARYAAPGPARRVTLVLGVERGQGASTVAAGLVLAASRTGAAALLIDADLRRSTPAGADAADDAGGLVDVVMGEQPLETAVRAWRGSAAVRTLTTGRLPAGAAAFLDAEVLAAVLEQAALDHDEVVVDGGAVHDRASTRELARHVSDVVLVARVGRTTRGALQAAVRALAPAGTLRGIAVVGVAPRDAGLASTPTPIERIREKA